MIVLLIFFSGKIVITGAKNMQDVYNGWKSMLELLHKYIIKNRKNILGRAAHLFSNIQKINKIEKEKDQ